MIKAGQTFARLTRLDRGRWQLLVRSGIALGVASFAVACQPFSQAVRFGCVPLGRRRGTASVEDVIWAVQAWSRRMPWRTMCIEQGIAAQRLLRLGGTDALLHYGARNPGDDHALQAHVWVSVEGRTVIGGEDSPEFTEIANYP